MKKSLKFLITSAVAVLPILFTPVPSVAQISDLTTDEKAEDALIGTAWQGNLNGLPMDLYLLDRHRLASKIGNDPAAIRSWFIKGDKMELGVMQNGGVFSLRGTKADNRMSGTGLDMKGPTGTWETTQQATPAPALLDKVGPAGISAAPPKANPKDFTGRFSASFQQRNGDPSTLITLTVECDSTISCILSRGNDTATFDYISEVRRGNFNEAKSALNYAREHKAKAKQQAPYLASLLDSSVEIETCVDLRTKPQQPNSEPSLPGYLLLCKPTAQLGIQTTVLLMGTILSNCGEAFCRFDITPLSK